MKFNKMKWDRFIFHIAPLLLFLGLMLGMSSHTPMWMDEYVFYRLSSELPSYASTSNWFFEDRPDMLNPTIEWENIDKKESFALVYDTPVYPHTPLPTILVYPFVKGLNVLADHDIIPHIEDQPGITVDGIKNPVGIKVETMTWMLRIIPMALCLLTLYLIFKLMYKKVGRNAYLYSLPVAAGMMMLSGAFLFYWDVFMMLFFVLTMYLMETKPNSKWKYVTACCLVNTKMFLGMVFLIPIFVKAFMDDRKNCWKMLLPLLSILPFYFVTVGVTGDWLYLWTHYSAQVPIHNYIYTLNSPKDYLMIMLNLGMPLYLLMTLPVFAHIKRHFPYVVFFVIAMTYAWATGLGLTHTTTMIYAGAMIFPLVASDLDLMGKLQKLSKWVNGETSEAN